MRKVLIVAALALLATSANATVWTITGGGMSTWFTDGTNGGGLQNIYESGVGTNAEFPGPRVNGYNCIGIGGGTGGPYTVGDDTCGDDTGEGTATELWGASAVYSGTIDDQGTATAADDTGSFSWTGESGTGAPAGFELFTNSIVSGAYNVDGSTPTGTYNCWNNPAAVGGYGADFCGNGSGGATLTTAAGQSLVNRALPNGIIALTDNLNGTIQVVMSDTTYTSCTAAANGTCDSSSSDTFAVWEFTVAGAIPVPAAVWLFGSALGLLGWVRRRASLATTR